MILGSTKLCNFLSYRYMSSTFGISYLLSIFVTWVLCRGIMLRKKCQTALCVILLGISVAGVSCLLYKVIWDLALKLFQITKASYRGAEHLSISLILRKLPFYILMIYKEFYNYFFNKNIQKIYFSRQYSLL